MAANSLPYHKPFPASTEPFQGLLSLVRLLPSIDHTLGPPLWSSQFLCPHAPSRGDQEVIVLVCHTVVQMTWISPLVEMSPSLALLEDFTSLTLVSHFLEHSPLANSSISRFHHLSYWCQSIQPFIYCSGQC